MNKYLAGLILFFYISNLSGSFIKGNGGNSIICKNSKNLVLDFYEMSNYYGLTFDDQLNVENLFRNSISRIEKINSEWKQLLIDELNLVDNKIVYVLNSRLGKVDDLITVLIPEDCELTQTALQFNNRILIDKESFDKLDSFQQETLLLHESVYAFLVKKNNLKNSKAVRAIVSLLLSREILFMTKSQIDSFYRQEIAPNF